MWWVAGTKSKWQASVWETVKRGEGGKGVALGHRHYWPHSCQSGSCYQVVYVLGWEPPVPDCSKGAEAKCEIGLYCYTLDLSFKNLLKLFFLHFFILLNLKLLTHLSVISMVTLHTEIPWTFPLSIFFFFLSFSLSSLFLFLFLPFRKVTKFCFKSWNKIDVSQ